MLVGMTYDLRQDYMDLGLSEEDLAEFDSPRTVEGIETALRELGYQTERIGHVRHLAARLSAGDRWDLVFNICEGLGGYGREAQVPALLEAYGLPFVFSDPLVMALTLHKGMTKHVIRDLGLPTPDFVVVEDISAVAAIDLPYPLFAKPVAEGTGKGITAASKILDREQLHRVCGQLLAAYGQPVLVETYLPGREYTVGILGTGSAARVIAVMEVVLLANAEAEVYSYTNKEYCDDRVVYRLAEGPEAEKSGEVALACWRGLGCRDGGRVDIRVDGRGAPNFMEVNPLAGLHPEHSDLPILCNLAGVSFTQLIDSIMQSAVARFPGLDQPVSTRSAAGG
jgi:D-alanine-D-alanine ligase